MRNFLIAICCIVFAGFILLSLQTLKQKVRSDLYSPLETRTVDTPTAFPTVDVKKNPNEKKSLFIPYWSLSTKNIPVEDYDTAIYFGVVPTENGINTSEIGYTKLPSFISKTSGWRKHFLTLRMLDNKMNFSILDDPKKQDGVVRELLKTATDNGFDGVILDLELSALPFESVITQVNGFTKKLSQASNTANLDFSMMIYGDTFYRVRPFEIKTLGTYTDELYIMAYDFSKAKGNPGPNFPLSGKDTYGYDYITLIRNFTQVVSPKKLTVVFGMYGYDWTVDDKNISSSLAEPLSLNKIEQNVISTCVYVSCTWERDADAGEIKAEYKDSNNIRHIVWFEDTESVNRKMEFLKKQGITSYSFWAYSYF